MLSSYPKGLFWVLVCLAVSILWGGWVGRDGNAWVDFRAVYAGTRCLIHHHNPYSVSDLEREYASEDGQRPPNGRSYIQAITLYVNMPTTFVLVAPFAVLPWGPAYILWMLATGCVFVLAILMMWSIGARYEPQSATLLACVIAINCESIFAAGNTAGMVVGLCGIAVWCLIQNRFLWMGVVCLALSLAVKPHDAGLVWLYFLLAGGVHRKRALRSLAITTAIGLVAALWISHVAPHWMHDWEANLSTISAPGGINEPGPDSVSGHSTYMVVDLQAALSIFRDNPRFYNPASYLVCGAFLLVWLIRTLRTRFSIPNAWLALAAVVPCGLLITYHRPWDAKLVILAIPACSMLWARRNRLGKIAMLVTVAATFFAGDASLAFFKGLADELHPGTATLGGQLLTVVLRRPESIALLAMGVFYMWAYVMPAEVLVESVVEADVHA